MTDFQNLINTKSGFILLISSLFSLENQEIPDWKSGIGLHSMKQYICLIMWQGKPVLHSPSSSEDWTYLLNMGTSDYHIRLLVKIRTVLFSVLFHCSQCKLLLSAYACPRLHRPWEVQSLYEGCWEQKELSGSAELSDYGEMPVFGLHKTEFIRKPGSSWWKFFVTLVFHNPLLLYPLFHSRSF